MSLINQMFYDHSDGVAILIINEFIKTTKS